MNLRVTGMTTGRDYPLGAVAGQGGNYWTLTQYLALLCEQTAKYQVGVEGYCLLSNHVHLALVPPNEQALARAVGRTHYRYTQYVKATYGRSGHLWQNRFFSRALDDEHYRTALRYIERNPPRAHLVAFAADYRWSSAAAHLGGVDDTGPLDCDQSQLINHHSQRMNVIPHQI